MGRQVGFRSLARCAPEKIVSPLCVSSETLQNVILLFPHKGETFALSRPRPRTRQRWYAHQFSSVLFFTNWLVVMPPRGPIHLGHDNHCTVRKIGRRLLRGMSTPSNSFLFSF